MDQNKIAFALIDPFAGDCGRGFKEWEGVCAALGSGRQVLIFRKGGVAEDHGLFVPDRDRFWLYPTRVHEAEQGLREGFGGRSTVENRREITIDLFARVETIKRVDDWKTLVNLYSEHIWTEATIRKRFDYREPGLWCMIVRVYRSEPAWSIAVDAAAAGCKTWVEIPTPTDCVRLNPVIDDAEFSERVARIECKWNGESNREAAN